MVIKSFTVGPFQENSFVISSESSADAFIIDPGEAEPILQYVKENNLNVKAIINTHAHIDHVLGVADIKNRLNVPFYLHQDDEVLLNGLQQQAAMFGMNITEPPKIDTYLESGGSMQLDDTTLEIIYTPGHSPGSVSFFTGDEIFSGDVLFEGSIGRTDLYGGSYDTLIASIREKLLPLGDEVTVYPGHGSTTTIGKERRSNPFLV